MLSTNIFVLKAFLGGLKTQPWAYGPHETRPVFNNMSLIFQVNFAPMGELDMCERRNYNLQVRDHFLNHIRTYGKYGS